MHRALMFSHEKNRSIQNYYLQTMLAFSLPVQVHSTTQALTLQTSLTNVKTPSLSGCLTCLGSHLTANQIESFILSKLSHPTGLSSSWSHTQTEPSYQIPLLLLSPALQLTDLSSQENIIKN